MLTGGGFGVGSKSGINQSNIPMMGGITSGTGMNMMGMSEANNSADLDIEFGYCSEEESYFMEFSDSIDNELPKVKKIMTNRVENKKTQGIIKEMVKKYTEKNKKTPVTHEYLVKFKLQDYDHSMNISNISNVMDHKDQFQQELDKKVDERERRKID
jgi:hypothetical protein